MVILDLGRAIILNYMDRKRAETKRNFFGAKCHIGPKTTRKSRVSMHAPGPKYVCPP